MNVKAEIERLRDSHPCTADILEELNRNIDQNTNMIDDLRPEVTVKYRHKDKPPEELKPCPFCKCRRIKLEQEENNGYSYYCSNCLVSTPYYFNRVVAFETWQRRSNA